MNIRQFDFWEHRSEKYLKLDFPEGRRISSKFFGKSTNRYSYEVHHLEEHYKISAGYFIGVDWLADQHSSIVVAPKLNTRVQDILDQESSNEEIDFDPDLILDKSKGEIVNIDYFALLQKCLDVDYLYQEIDDLVYVDWNAPEIPIRHDVDWLSPLVIIKFLNVLKTIVRKGLKKSYYQTVQNLNSRVKGKILIAQNIKNNMVKNKPTNTVCRFEEFGVDGLDNRLLKKAFRFSQSYLDNYAKVFNGNSNHFNDLINYCRPAFESISDTVNVAEIRDYKANPFFKEYTEAISLAKMILQRFAYSVSNTTKETLTTPPYWIDMPKLFELYVYHFLKKKFPKANDLIYHPSTHGNELDFLVNDDIIKMVIDAKYKPLYIYGKNHQDIRQVSGYARLEKIYTMIGLKDDKLIDCLVIYPDINNGLNMEDFEIQKRQAIHGYRRIYKIGIKLPVK